MRKCLPLLILLLNGCAQGGLLRGSGEEAPAPIGHAAACINDPSLSGCPK